MFRSSIFSFETLREFPWPTKAGWTALMLCALFRLCWPAFAGFLENFPSNAVDPGLVEREKRLHVGSETPPTVLLLGSSRTAACFVPEQMAKELDLPAGGVRCLTDGAGTPWDVLVTFRRNPWLLDHVRLVVVDCGPWQMNDHFDQLLPNRFYWHATLHERLQLSGGTKWKAVADWFWPYVSQRRELKFWLSGFHNVCLRQSGRETGPSEEAVGAFYWRLHADGKTRAEVLNEPKQSPPGFAQRALGKFVFSRRMETALRELLDLLRRHQITLLLHQPPMHSEFFDWLGHHPQERAAYQTYLQFIHSLASDRVHLRIWEKPEDVGLIDDDLLDYGHFGRHAADIYTSAIREVITREHLLSNGATNTRRE